jgi:phosphinothricin acetyltransferase
MVEIRTATTEDAKSILDIYSPSILNTAISFETEIPSIEEIQKRIEKCLEKFPWIVCAIDKKIAGYVYASKHRDRDAYQWTCESSVYIHNDFKGKGIGKNLYACLFAILKLQGLRNVYAGITLPNNPSVQLHERCGFEHFVTYDKVGYKFYNWHDVGWWKLQLNDYDLEPPPPIPFSEMNQHTLKAVYQKVAEYIQARING